VDAEAIAGAIDAALSETPASIPACAFHTTAAKDIFTDWNTTFSASKGLCNGVQTFTGGSGKFSGIIQGSNPFQCQLVGKEGQFLCTQNWTYQLTN
jgi:hypothetical protein